MEMIENRMLIDGYYEDYTSEKDEGYYEYMEDMYEREADL